ncbi:hypothetical protein [Mycobacterium paragordonae]|uniref:Uncharacterized protein n=1 Tax=Mycobacterium paragordonae TaxID=1389713 RepID=A0AAJ1SAL8_9MYCO|nr:hypothetical protein [Mycobacterium paragordonae]MDP7739690.1 hypothetical protein [Mycobacterium paragordonae]
MSRDFGIARMHGIESRAGRHVLTLLLGVAGIGGVHVAEKVAPLQPSIVLIGHHRRWRFRPSLFKHPLGVFAGRLPVAIDLCHESMRGGARTLAAPMIRRR